MDVHLRSAIHPLLGRFRIGAPRLWPLSPELQTSDCSFACPGSSTWVDKVPSQDTPNWTLRAAGVVWSPVTLRSHSDRLLEATVLPDPGVAPGVVALALGYGRTRA